MQTAAVPEPASLTGAAKVITVRDVPALREWRSHWERWQSHPNTDLDFYLTILRERSEIVRPHVMLACRGDVAEAMLVGRIDRKRLPFRLGYWRLFQPFVRVLTLPYAGLLGDASEENCRALAAAVVTALRRGEADVAHFEALPTECPLYQQARNLPSRFCRDYGRTRQNHRSMALPGSRKVFEDSLSAKVRKNLRWQAKRLHSEYAQVRIETYASPGDLDTVLRDVEAIACKTYQRGLGVGFRIDSEMLARLRKGSRLGRFRAYVLYLGGSPAAFWLGTIYQQTFHSDFMGYDPARAKYSPGMFLTTEVIGGFCDRTGRDRPRDIDFGHGDAQYKDVLSTRCWSEAAVYIFSPRLRGVFMNLIRTALGITDGFLRNALHRTHSLGRIKALWRKAVHNPDATAK